MESLIIANNNDIKTRPEIILFDWDHTLVDSGIAIFEAMQATLRAMGHEVWTREETRQNIRLSLRDSFPKLFGDEWQKAKDIFYGWFEEHHLEYIEPLPNAEKLLIALKEMGIDSGLVSNKTGRFLRAEVKALGWGEYFNAEIGAGDAKKDKPAIEHAHLALEKMFPVVEMPKICRNKVWFVGDTLVDIECGAAIGALPVFIGDTPIAKTEDIDKFEPLRVDDCAALLKIINDLPK